MQDLNIRVTWQMAVVISSLAVFPIAGTGLVAALIDPNEPGASKVIVIAGAVVVATLALTVWAIRSRLASEPDREERRAILKQIGRGIGGIAAAGALTAIAYFVGVVAGWGPRVYVVPTGLYFVGLIAIAKAMVMG